MQCHALRRLCIIIVFQIKIRDTFRSLKWLVRFPSGYYILFQFFGPFYDEKIVRNFEEAVKNLLHISFQIFCVEKYFFLGNQIQVQCLIKYIVIHNKSCESEYSLTTIYKTYVANFW